MTSLPLSNSDSACRLKVDEPVDTEILDNQGDQLCCFVAASLILVRR